MKPPKTADEGRRAVPVPVRMERSGEGVLEARRARSAAGRAMASVAKEVATAIVDVEEETLSLSLAQVDWDWIGR